MTNNIMNLLEEMVNEASKEIGFESDSGNVDQVLTELENSYGIELNIDAPITWQIMNILTEVIQEWQSETLKTM